MKKWGEKTFSPLFTKKRNKNMEIWKTIKDFGEGNFLVSNLGNIKRKAYTFYKNNKSYNYKEANIKVHYGKRKYGQVTLCYKGNTKQYYIHVLVATAFIDNPFNKKEINHIDGNKRNNNVNNLEWVTRAENMFHAKENNLLKPNIGGNHHASIKVVAYDYKTRTIINRFL